MITRMVQERIGEWLGDIDWSYDFSRHFTGCCSEEMKIDIVYEHVLRLWEINQMYKRGVNLLVFTYQYAHPLLCVGMYDGWPYWKPTPTILIAGALGAETQTFYSIDGWQKIKVKANS